jgi:surface antigen
VHPNGSPSVKPKFSQISPLTATQPFGRREKNPVIRIAIRSALIAALTILSACGTTRDTPGDSGGGSTSGGLLGSDDGTSAIVKSMGGGLVGGSVGIGLGEDEKARALEAEYRALEHSQAGQPVTWKGDSAATYGEAVAAQPYRVGSQDCRQYTQTVYRDGQSKIARGTACRNADGSWTPLT